MVILRAAPSPELQRYYDEDPSRQQTALVMVGVLAAIGLVSLWMLRAKKSDGKSDR